jgi:signal transduction histidine kinase
LVSWDAYFPDLQMTRAVTELPAENIARPEPERLNRWRTIASVGRSNARDIAVFIAVLALLASIVWADWTTGPDVHLALYYCLPALVAAWVIGRGAGFVMAVVTTGVWLKADLLGATRYAHSSYAYLNSIIRLPALMAAVYLLSAFHQMRNHLAEQVARRTRALRDLSLRLSQAEESERDRLARDVYDGLGQSLTLLKLNLAGVISEAQVGKVPLQRMEEAVTLVSNLIERSRTLTFELHPTMLDTLGLVPTLQHYGHQFSRQAAVEVIINQEGDPTALPGAMTSYLFRAVKELMTNAAKHGGAREIIISLYWNSDRVRIVVDDDGTGFNPDASARLGTPPGIGLAGIRERIASLQGTVSVESSAGSGARVVIDLPATEKGSGDDSKGITGR